VGIPVLKQCISTFKNLSTIILIHRLGRDFYGGYPRWKSGIVWNGFKELAISQLEGSLTDGPKKLKTIEVFVEYDQFEPKLVAEERIVQVVIAEC